MMKIIGILLVLGALVGGGIILSDTIPGYFNNKDRLARSRTEAAAAVRALDTLGPNSSESQIRGVTKTAEEATEQIRYDEDSVARRRNESLMFGGGALVLLVLGAFLFVRGRRKQPSQRPALAAA